MSALTPFQLDLLEQPEALERLAGRLGPIRSAVADLAARDWPRLVLSGMGSSDFAAIPTWRALVATGRPVWTSDAGRLLDSPQLITAETLLVLTSQSGASGEIVELLDRIDAGDIARPTIVGIAADETSPLATRSDVFLPLHSGPEATVSTKSYLNTLAVHRALTVAFTREEADLAAEVAAAADVVRRQLDTVDLAQLTADAYAGPDRRLATVGSGDHATTALLAGLITKESSKVAIEGFIGGQFRHGPFELAGPGLTVFFYGADAGAADSAERIATQLVAAGSRAVLVGDLRIDGATTIAAPGSGLLARLASETVVAELTAVGLAQANGVEPGVFHHGSKVTTAL